MHNHNSQSATSLLVWAFLIALLCIGWKYGILDIITNAIETGRIEATFRGQGILP